MKTVMRRVNSERKSTSSSHQSLSRPSSFRRSLSVSHPATSITKHYELNDKILAAFDSLYTNKCFEVAYAMGMQFIEMALVEIPKHGYFYSTRHSQERRQHSLEAERVCKLLQQIVGEEELHEQQRLEQLAKRARQQAQETRRPPVVPEEAPWTESILCGEAIADLLCPQQHTLAEAIPLPKQQDEAVIIPVDRQQQLPPQQPIRHRIPHLVEPPETRMDYSTDREEEKQEILPPPIQLERDYSIDMVRQPADYLYEDYCLSADESEDLERALFLSGLDVRPSEVESTTSSSIAPPARPPTKTSHDLDIQVLKECYHDDFDQVLSLGRVVISRIPTHQGRLVGSINGCTLIAPLLCIRHFQCPHLTLSDDTIEHVIDVETSELLPEVRYKLGLTKDALIIPSDVHDFLLDRGMLNQDQFVTVVGGNILDEPHLSELVHSMDGGGGKIAATIFFHEHVICILTIPGEGFDLIDSLPYEDTLNSSNHSSDNDDEEYIPYAARIRCKDEEALRATLRWYACSKFNEQDCTYIDMYAWDDMHSDFDPRVFQAFVWSA